MTDLKVSKAAPACVAALAVALALLVVILIHNEHVASRRCQTLHGVLLHQPGLRYACIEQGKHP